MNNEKILFKVLTGSHLYGTSGPESDFDYKAVYLPALNNLLLNRKIVNHKEKPEGLGAGDKMVAGGVETEYIPFQVFLDDFFNGQTYALELAFAVAQGMHMKNSADEFEEKCGSLGDTMSVLIEKFLTNNIKKMVGYAVSQSEIYGLKSERFTSMKAAISAVELYRFKHVHELFASNGKYTLLDCPVLVQQLLILPHVVSCEVGSAPGGLAPRPAINICGKKFPLDSKVEHVLTSIKRNLENYGERVASFEGEDVDWKAMSHAIRIIEQVLELTAAGKIEFPRKNAEFLRAVKNGQMPILVAREYLEGVFLKVDAAVSSSILQEKTPKLEEEFTEWKLNLLRTLYDLPKT